MARTRLAVTPLEDRVVPAGTVSEQIIVDQFGWRADARGRSSLFADPINGQNARRHLRPGCDVPGPPGVATTPSSTPARCRSGTPARRTARPATGSGPATSPPLTTPGEYYVYDPANDRRSFAFRLDDDLFNDVLKTSVRTFYYQRSGHRHLAAARRQLDHAATTSARTGHPGASSAPAPAGVAGSRPRRVRRVVRRGGLQQVRPVHHRRVVEPAQRVRVEPGRVPATTGTSPRAATAAGHPRRAQVGARLAAAGCSCPTARCMNRVAQRHLQRRQLRPATDTQPRYYTAATTWATASFAASLAHAAHVFARGTTRLRGDPAARPPRTRGRTCAATPAMTPRAAATAGSGWPPPTPGPNANGDRRAPRPRRGRAVQDHRHRRVQDLLRGQLQERPARPENGHHPLLDGPAFDAIRRRPTSTAPASPTPPRSGANAHDRQRDQDRSASNHRRLAHAAASTTTGPTPTAGSCGTGTTRGAPTSSRRVGQPAVYAIKLNVSPADTAKYRRGRRGVPALLPRPQPALVHVPQQHGGRRADEPRRRTRCRWRSTTRGSADGSALYDGANSTYGPAPGYLVGGPNQFFSRPWIAPPGGSRR